LQAVEHPILHRVEELSALAKSKDDTPALVEILCKYSDKNTGKFCSLQDAQQKLQRKKEAEALRKAQEATQNQHTQRANTTKSQESDTTKSPEETPVDPTSAQDSGTDSPEMAHNGSSPHAPTKRCPPTRSPVVLPAGRFVGVF
jgi:hypothetical protein